MNSAQYRQALIALIQVLKALTKEKHRLDFERMRLLLEQFLVLTPPTDGYALRNVVKDLSSRFIRFSLTTDEWSVNYELCRDMLGMLDVPYNER